MPNLVGIGLSQVPTNSMLGGLAYQNPEHASIKDLDLKNLSQINSEIADTAVDVFIYDTSKDSDGGAWRKRTRNTSWYNETLGTATRGTRKEFPAVAVIVAELAQLTIYDGDDPDLSMWMVFNFLDGETHFNGYDNDRYLSSVAALNGTIVTGIGHVNGFLNEIGFIEDAGYSRTPGYYQRLHANISQRNQTGFSKTLINTSDGIVNRNVNDVAMTVLPNAPIDSATGLPVPTIAVGTEGGVSVIKDDGTVVDLTGSDTYVECNNVFFSDYGKLLYDNEDTQLVYEVTIPSSDTNYGVYNSTSNGRVIYPVGTHGGFSSGEIRLLGTNVSEGGRLITKGAFAVDNHAGVETIHGLTLFDREESDPAKQSLVAYVASDYNTGWMQGNIKGAYLSDTDTTNVSDTQVLTNHDFANGITGWTINLNGASGGSPGITVSSNKLVFQQGTSNSVWLEAYQVITTVIGQRYSVTINVASTNTSANWRVYADGVKILGYPSSLSQGSHTAQFVATSTTASIQVQQGGSANTSGEINSVSVIRMEEDRSVNNNALTVYGTITKTPVATGADLVGYSFNSSNSNYLEQPYNSDLDFGTGAFSITAWLKIDNDNTCIAVDKSIQNGTQTNRFVLYYDGSTNNFRLYDSAGTVNSSAVELNRWYHVVVVKEGNGGGKIYINGKLDNTSSALTGNNSNTGHKLVIGNGYNYTYAWRGSIALVRISGSVPSPEQIKKMYEDEKHLFQENAKCTLYGSSDAVTALAYDEVTNHLHVGTSAGRSDFQGLRRINNTTTAVTTAISAHDEFIIEQ